MKGFTIGAPNSRSGKTTLTLGIIRALKIRGIDVCGAKTGPDFVDTIYLSHAAGKRAVNLDRHMIGDKGIKETVGGSDFLVVEGVMGYFDGKGLDYCGSSFDVANILDIPSIITFTPEGEALTGIIKLKGMIDFSKGRIKGVIFNKVSQKYYEMLSVALKEYTGVRAYGFLNRDDKLKLSEERLGLSVLDNEKIEDYINTVAEEVEKTVDLDGLIDLATDVKTLPYPKIKNLNKKIAVAYDKAFSFIYEDNLRILKSLGEVNFFSPISDSKIPECDFLYLPGGMQFNYIKELSENKRMIESIRDFSENGGRIFAEGGGFEYLIEIIKIFKGEVRPTKRLNRFGYHILKANSDNLFLKSGETYPSQEYHKTEIIGLGEGIMEVIKNGEVLGTDGYLYKNTFGMENYVNFLYNPQIWERVFEG